MDGLSDWQLSPGAYRAIIGALVLTIVALAKYIMTLTTRLSAVEREARMGYDEILRRVLEKRNGDAPKDTRR